MFRSKGNSKLSSISGSSTSATGPGPVKLQTQKNNKGLVKAVRSSIFRHRPLQKIDV